jgi:RimJ/RimL family protein N-acetyltransferase
MLILVPGESSRDTLIAEIDPDNKASERVVEKLGFKKGELLKGCYQRASEARVGISEKRDQQIWYLHRPTKGLWNGVK